MRDPLLTPTKKAVLALLAICFFSQAAGAADRAETVTTAIDQAFRPLLDEYDVPGMAIGVTLDGEEYFVSYGTAAKGKEVPVTKDALFELGSVSKTFTATLGTYAVAQNKTALDDHPSRFLPQLKGARIDKASLLELGTYTAGGLPLQLPDEVSDDGNAVSYLSQWKPDAAPGEKRRYSNPSIGLFGHVAGLTLGGGFASEMEGTVLPKLGLKRSFIRVPETEMASYAWGTSKAGKLIRVNPGAFDAEAYGIKSSAADMIHFIEANIDPSKLEPAMRKAVEATHLGYFRIGPMVQGLGWEQYPFPVTLDRLLEGNSTEMATEAKTATRLDPPQKPSEATLFNKTGSTGGFGAYAAFAPEKRIGIVMLANRNFPNAARIKAAHAVLEVLASEK